MRPDLPDRPALVRPAATRGRRRPQRTQSGKVLVVGVATIALIMAVAALREARLFAIPTVIAGLAALAMTPAARSIERSGLPRGATAALLVITALTAMMVGLWLILPSAEAFTRQAPDIVRDLERMLRAIEIEVAEVAEQAERVENPPTGADPDEKPEEERNLVRSALGILSDTLFTAPALIGALVYGVFLAFFLLSERTAVYRGVLRMGATQRTRMLLGRAMRDVRLNVSAYLLTITLINIALGCATALAFWAVGMPDPALWGALMAVLNFIPYLGPVLMNVLVFAAGLVILPQPGDVVWALAALLTLNTIESNLVTPSLVSRQMSVGPLAVFLGIAFGAWLWGTAGALIATPALIVATAFARRFSRRRRALQVEPLSPRPGLLRRLRP